MREKLKRRLAIIFLAALIGLAEAPLVSSEPPGYGLPVEMTPPISVTVATEDDLFAGIAAYPIQSGGSFRYFVDEALVGRSEYAVGGRFLRGGVSHRFEFEGPTFRFLLANVSLTRLWGRDWVLNLVLDRPEAIQIIPEHDYFSHTGHFVNAEGLRIKATLTGNVTGTLYSESLEPLDSGTQLTAGGDMSYYLSFNAERWPATLNASIALEPDSSGQPSFPIVTLVLLAVPIVFFILLIGLAYRRRRKTANRKT